MLVIFVNDSSKTLFSYEKNRKKKKIVSKEKKIFNILQLFSKIYFLKMYYVNTFYEMVVYKKNYLFFILKDSFNYDFFFRKQYN